MTRHIYEGVKTFGKLFIDGLPQNGLERPS